MVYNWSDIKETYISNFKAKVKGIEKNENFVKLTEVQKKTLYNKYSEDALSEALAVYKVKRGVWYGE
ncbi:hypothetical protein FACS1894188_11420 [Clostridia bacterium]|nr:hypothetical protein FACS1894188_11420 [Clostridia bacterium]